MNNKNVGKFSAKGYYIALVLCAFAIGISGYLYYRNTNQNDPQLQQPDVTVDSPIRDDDLPVVAPDGSEGHKDPDKVTDTDPTKPQGIKTCAPLEGKIITSYAMECLAYNETTRDWRTHNGIDMAAEAGTKVCAAADGTVYNVYKDDTMGTTIVIAHQDGYVTEYASLSGDVCVAAGDLVKMGQTIGYVGNTALVENAIGDHLHFAVTKKGESTNPEAFLNQK